MKGNEFVIVSLGINFLVRVCTGDFSFYFLLEDYL